MASSAVTTRSLPFYPDPELKKFGEEVMASLFDADVQRSMAGLGGCKAAADRAAARLRRRNPTQSWNQGSKSP